MPPMGINVEDDQRGNEDRMSLFGPRKLGLALGSGGARGLAHIGVLRALESEGLNPDVITGSSMGAIVGSLYAAGVSLDKMEQMALSIEIRSFIEWREAIFGTGAVLSGDKLEALLRKHLPPVFEDLKLPFGCVATDLTHGQRVRFSSGDLPRAVVASATIPSVFPPVRVDDMQLVDGSVTEPIPVLFAKQLGAQKVVAVDANGCGTMPLAEEGASEGAHALLEMRRMLVDGASRPRGTTPLDILITVQEMYEQRIARPALQQASVIISPDVHEVPGLAFEAAREIIDAGERAALAAIPEIRQASRRRSQ